MILEQEKERKKQEMWLYRPAFMYLPACLISQTGGLSTSSPRTALSKSGSVVFTAFRSATGAGYSHKIQSKIQIKQIYILHTALISSTFS